MITSDDLHPPEADAVITECNKRLLDKSMMARKNAILLMCAIVQKYPLIVKVS